MEPDEIPAQKDDFVERAVIAWGLPGAIVGLVILNAGIFFLWRYALSFFYPGA